MKEQQKIQKLQSRIKTLTVIYLIIIGVIIMYNCYTEKLVGREAQVVVDQATGEIQEAGNGNDDITYISEGLQIVGEVGKAQCSKSASTIGSFILCAIITGFALRNFIRLKRMCDDIDDPDESLMIYRLWCVGMIITCICIYLFG